MWPTACKYYWLKGTSGSITPMSKIHLGNEACSNKFNVQIQINVPKYFLSFLILIIADAKKIKIKGDTRVSISK